MFLGELLAPGGERAWLVSPWISNVVLFDNRAGGFGSINPEWGSREIRLVEVLTDVMTRGTALGIATSLDNHNDPLIDALATAADEAADTLATLGLTDIARRKVVEIAYGQQRLLEIAIAMAQRPKVLLLDEPAAGVPSSDTPLIERALERLPASLAVLMIEHDMDLVFRFARRVVVLAAGELIFQGLPADVARDDKVREAYLGSYAHAGS